MTLPGECGGVFSSYALAYQSLDYQKNTGNCLRKQGEQVLLNYFSLYGTSFHLEINGINNFLKSE